MPFYEDYTTSDEERHRRPEEHRRAPGRHADGGGLPARSSSNQTPWIHLDIAGTAYLDNESAWQAKGPTGTPVRAFVALVEAPGLRQDDQAGTHPNGARGTEVSV